MISRTNRFLLTMIVVVVIATILSGLGFMGFRMFFLTFVDNYQLGYKYSRRTGQVQVLERTGWHFVWPVVETINTVDLRPMQVRIAANNRVLNAKLVQFNPGTAPNYEGLQLFLKWHGRDDYDVPSGSPGNETSAFSQILLSYAYEGTGKSYPFLTIVRELKTDDMTTTAVAK